MKIYSIVFLIFITNFTCFSQAKQDKYGQDYFEGGLVSSAIPAVPVPPTQKPVYLTILKYSTKDVMAGNLCVLEETRNMGFEYLVHCNPNVTFMTKIGTFLYNFGTNINLTFRNGFGWRKRLKNKIEVCRKNSGDYVW